MATVHKIEAIVDKLTQKFENSSGIYFTNYTGMNVVQATDCVNSSEKVVWTILYPKIL